MSQPDTAWMEAIVFYWTPAIVLRALDAGIAEIIQHYNAVYAQQVRLVGTAGGAAHDSTLQFVAAQGNDMERRLRERHVDHLFDALGINVKADRHQVDIEIDRQQAEYDAYPVDWDGNVI